MKFHQLSFFLVFYLTICSIVPIRIEAAGMTCVVCTILVEVISQVLNSDPQPIDTFVMEKFCTLFPGRIKETCDDFMNRFGEDIVFGLAKDYNADDICLAIGLCTNPQCRLLPKNSSNPEVVLQPGPNPNWELPDWILNIINDISNHRAAVDLDNDSFSTFPQLRGWNWRGRDCSDLDSRVHPGRKSNPYPFLNLDYNCNGISGQPTLAQMKNLKIFEDNPNALRESWKDVLCKDSGQRGVVVLGDSAGAHFSIPPEYVTPSTIDWDTFNTAPEVLLNEIDLPHKSAYTGYFESTEESPIRSIYKKMVERNRCNHRDYQNLGVNGEDSGTVLKNSLSLARDQTTDHPLLVFLELIGNDVCNGYPDGFEWMTKPEDFKKNIYELLHWLDTRVPADSHVFIFGLADGRILYDSLSEEFHPIGVQYKTFYDFLNCYETNPCWGWLNSNRTARDLTTERAIQLNQVYHEIINETKGQFKNFDIVYYDFPTQEIIDDWISRGGNSKELIEPVDGFHPSTTFHSLLADWVWDKLIRHHPSFIGEANPNNERIVSLFGDQGGH